MEVQDGISIWESYRLSDRIPFRMGDKIPALSVEGEVAERVRGLVRVQATRIRTSSLLYELAWFSLRLLSFELLDPPIRRHFIGQL
jgi:hypothetical protein